MIKNYIKEVYSWACKAKLSILCLLVLLAAFLFGFDTWQGEQSIRISGYFLQMIGMVFAIRGLLKIRAYFGQPKLRRLFIGWICRFPKWKKHITIQVDNGIHIVEGSDVRIDVWISDNPENSLKERLNNVAKNLEYLRLLQRVMSERIKELNMNQKKNQKEQELARVSIEKNIRSDLESLHTDDILVSLIGLIWLMVGISMSTMSQELSKLFLL